MALHAVTLESSRKCFCSIWTSDWLVCVCNPHRKMLKNEKETLMSLLFCIEAAEPYEAAMFFCVAEGHVEDGDLEEASVASEGDPIQSQSKLDGQRSRTLNDSEACAC